MFQLKSIDRLLWKQSCCGNRAAVAGAVRCQSFFRRGRVVLAGLSWLHKAQLHYGGHLIHSNSIHFFYYYLKIACWFAIWGIALKVHIS